MHQRDFAKTLRQTMTDAEQRLWKYLRAHRLDGQKFRRQQPIGPYIVDFVHFGARLIVEADGGQHADSPHDMTRDAWLRGQGFTVLRFWNDDILLRTEAVLESIWAVLQPNPSPPTPLPQGERGGNSRPHPSSSPARGEGSMKTNHAPAFLPSPLVGEGQGERGTSKP
ncbi:endonuclease domain-containing protein [Oryzisolibacter sp. LB2S]|uniref:endonuclease domain-containing protein n=1 Tax=Alicycliphilus soli TaxID=3228789 RepID=UPI003458860E